jgi:hypothetical protein
MYDKLKPRVPLTTNQLPSTKETYLAPHPLSEEHPYSFNPVHFDYPLSIPHDLAQQIARSKPPDGIRQLLKISAKLFYGYLRLTEKWMQRGDKERLGVFRQPEREVKFAKELFKIWDESSNGRLEIREVVLPMIANGLMRQRGDINKVMRALVEPG